MNLKLFCFASVCNRRDGFLGKMKSKYLLVGFSDSEEPKVTLFDQELHEKVSVPVHNIWPFVSQVTPDEAFELGVWVGNKGVDEITPQQSRLPQHLNYFSNSGATFTFLDQDGVVEFCSSPTGPRLGNCYFESLDANSRLKAEASFRKVDRTAGPSYYSTRQGEILYKNFLVPIAPLGDLKRYVIVSTQMSHDEYVFDAMDVTDLQTLTLDPNGMFLHRTALVPGFSVDEAIGCYCWDFLAEDEARSFRKVLQRAEKTRKLVPATVSLPSSEGKGFSLWSTTISAVFDEISDQLKGFFAIMRQIGP